MSSLSLFSARKGAFQNHVFKGFLAIAELAKQFKKLSYECIRCECVKKIKLRFCNPRV